MEEVSEPNLSINLEGLGIYFILFLALTLITYVLLNHNLGLNKNINSYLPFTLFIMLISCIIFIITKADCAESLTYGEKLAKVNDMEIIKNDPTKLKKFLGIVDEQDIKDSISSLSIKQRILYTVAGVSLIILSITIWIYREDILEFVLTPHESIPHQVLTPEVFEQIMKENKKD